MEAVASFLLISKPIYFRAGSPNLKSVIGSSRPSLQARQGVEGGRCRPLLLLRVLKVPGGRQKPSSISETMQWQPCNKVAPQMLLEPVHREETMKRTAQMGKDNTVNALLLLLFYHLSLIAGSAPEGVGSMERAFS